MLTIISNGDCFQKKQKCFQKLYFSELIVFLNLIKIKLLIQEKHSSNNMETQNFVESCKDIISTSSSDNDLGTQSNLAGKINLCIKDKYNYTFI